MKVLLIDDIPNTVKGIFDHCNEKGWPVQLVNFDEYLATLKEFEPDIVVLDWKDEITNRDAGNEILENIWGNSFKPVVIFSAIAAAISLDEKYKSSNLIIVQAKGDEETVIEYLDSINPFTPVISSLKKNFNDALIVALNSVEMMRKVETIHDDIIRYVFAKRVSAYFDEACEGVSPPAWIQYTFPAITKTLCVCDIIRRIPRDRQVNLEGNPEEYLIILTPSCDLAQGKVDKALCAKCNSKELFHNCGLSENPNSEKIKKVTTMLNNGYNNSLISLPSIPDVIPSLTAELKKTEFILIEKIAINEKSITAEHEYCRIVTIDSPYREQIVWAHMITSCRPGMPPRDMEPWAKEILQL